MHHDYDMEWLKKASKAWAQQNDIAIEQIKELIKQKWKLLDKKVLTLEDEKHIMTINKQIEGLVKQMESIELPQESES